MQRISVILLLAASISGCSESSPIGGQKDLIRTFTGHSDYVCDIVFRRDGKQIISGGADGKIKYWEVETGECQRSYDGHEEWVHAIAISPDGRRLASGGRDDLVKLWEIDSEHPPQVFEGHQGGLVKSVAYSPDGRLLASCGRDRFAWIWDVASGRKFKKLGTGGIFTPSAVEFTPDSKQMLFGGDMLQLWDIESGELVRTFEGHTDTVGDMTISQNGKYFASSGSYTDNSLRLWDAQTGEALWHKEFTESEGRSWSLIFCDDDKVLISGHHDGKVRFWDVKSGNLLRTIAAHSENVSALAIDPGEQYLASGSWDKQIKLWKLGPNELPR
jgi:WD40 repeat protein